MHAPLTAALEFPPPSPHSGPRGPSAQGLHPRPSPPACPAVPARRARAPHLQACLQPSSRLGSGSSLQVAWPRLQLRAGRSPGTRRATLCPPRLWAPEFRPGREGRPRAEEVTKAGWCRLATAAASPPWRLHCILPRTASARRSPGHATSGGAGGVGTAGAPPRPAPAPRLLRRPCARAPRGEGRAGWTGRCCSSWLKDVRVRALVLRFT